MKTNKKTKIVCTIGPASENEKILTELINHGMNVARLNFSHGDFAEHQKRVDRIKKISKKLDTPIAIMQDLCGPKIRIGKFENDFIVLKEGNKFTITTEKILGNSERVYVNYPLLPKEIKVGDAVFLQDGARKMKVLSVKGSEILCEVLVGGILKNNRGVNLPETAISMASITQKDRKDIDFGIKNKVDFVALSFVRKPEDVVELKNLLKKRGSKAGIISKIETPEAVQNIDKIIEVSDGVMVARGDLAIEINPEHVPLVQKMIIKKCNRVGKPVITATQILESMIHSPVPTRAEVSDVANAILDGTDAVMLSEETTLGKYPVQAVSMMSKIAGRVEGDSLHKKLSLSKREVSDVSLNVADAVCNEVVDVANSIHAKYIIALTESGFTAKMISRYKPAQKILVMTTNKETYNKIVLNFGCFPFLTKNFKDLGEALSVMKKFLWKEKLVEKGDKVVVVAGMPLGKGGQTNMLLVEEI